MTLEIIFVRVVDAIVLNLRRCTAYRTFGAERTVSPNPVRPTRIMTIDPLGIKESLRCS